MRWNPVPAFPHRCPSQGCAICRWIETRRLIEIAAGA